MSNSPTFPGFPGGRTPCWAANSLCSTQASISTDFTDRFIQTHTLHAQHLHNVKESENELLEPWKKYRHRNGSLPKSNNLFPVPRPTTSKNLTKVNHNSLSREMNQQTHKQNNKPVGEWISSHSPNFVAMATRVGPTTFRTIPLNRPSPKTPGMPKHLWSICHTSRVIGDFVQILGSKFWALGA